MSRRPYKRGQRLRAGQLNKTHYAATRSTAMPNSIRTPHGTYRRDRPIAAQGFDRCTCKLSTALLTSDETVSVYYVQPIKGTSPLDDSDDMTEVLYDVYNTRNWDGNISAYCEIRYNDTHERWEIDYLPCEGE